MRGFERNRRSTAVAAIRASSSQDPKPGELPRMSSFSNTARAARSCVHGATSIAPATDGFSH
jgi:hypothetical protein